MPQVILSEEEGWQPRHGCVAAVGAADFCQVNPRRARVVMRIQEVECMGDGVGLAGHVAEQMLVAGLTMSAAVNLLREKLLIRALENSGGNISVAARALGQHRNTTARELERLHLAHLPADIRRRRVQQTVLAFSTAKPGEERLRD